MIKKEPNEYVLSDAAEAGRPVLYVDPGICVNLAKEFRASLGRVKPYYALKCFNDDNVINAIDEYVTGYDVASLGEIEQLLRHGVNPERMLFSNTVKFPSHISGAFKVGVNKFAFDSTDEIIKLAQLAPGAKVYLRIKVDDQGSAMPLSSKFGVSPLHAVSYCGLAQDVGLDVVGIAFHVGSQSTNPDAWLSALSISKVTIERLNSAGFDIRMLNIGGGFPADYGANDQYGFTEIANVICEYIEQEFDDSLNIVAEPGRFLVAEAGYMVCSVIASSIRSGKKWLHLDVGAFQGLMEPLISSEDFKYPVKNLDKLNDKSMTSFTLTGPTCDSCDTIGHDYQLSTSTEAGDRILIASVGAYTLPYASSFNSINPPVIKYI